MEFTELPIDFFNAANDDPNLFDEADARIRKLAQGHTDIVGAQVNIRPESQKRDNNFDVTVVLYIRPEQIAATAFAPQPMQALKQALDEVERQVYRKREKLRGY
jgi:ribosome-associated translation inhibitor RaiA